MCGRPTSVAARTHGSRIQETTVKRHQHAIADSYRQSPGRGRVRAQDESCSEVPAVGRGLPATAGAFEADGFTHEKGELAFTRTAERQHGHVRGERFSARERRADRGGRGKKMARSASATRSRRRCFFRVLLKKKIASWPSTARQRDSRSMASSRDRVAATLSTRPSTVDAVIAMPHRTASRR